ncbi:Ig-like domain-containing protein [Pseudocitrobacter faecalis]
MQIDNAPVSVAMDVITADNVLNAAEKAGEVVLSGTTSGIEDGQVVTLTVGNKQFTATVNNNTWSTTVPAGSLAALRDGEVTVQLSVSTVSGNKATNSHTFEVDTHAPVLAIDPVTADNILNSTELSQPLTLTGTSDAIGQTLTLTLNGKTHDAVVGSDGRWSLNVSAADLVDLNDGLNDIKLVITDAANNRTETTHSVLVDTVAPTPTINTVAGDDKINITELGQALVISGGTTNGTTGDKVSVVLNGKTYTTQLDANGNWSVGVPAADMAVLESIGYDIKVTVTDSAGNSQSLEHTIDVDTGIPTLRFDTLSTDGVLNAIEQMQPLAVSGISSLAEGTVVTVTLNGVNYQTQTEAGGGWSVSVPADALAKLGEADYTLTASAAGSSGNSVTDTTTLLVDTRAPTITILPVSDDDIIGMTEMNGVVTINGTVSGAAENDVVTVIIAGQSHTTNVKSDGTWTVALGAGELSALGSGPLTITASVTNGHGNIGSGQHGITLDSTEPGIRIDSVTADNTLNLAERASELVISGTTTDVAMGSTVTVSVNNTLVGTAVTQADGSWLLQLTPDQMANWNGASITVNASVANVSGNDAAINESVALDLRETSVSINPVTADNVVNGAEKSGEIVLTGDTTNIDNGRTVTVTVNGKQFTGTVQDNAWSVTLDAGALNGLRDGDAVVQVSVSNASGNSASNSLNFVIDTTAPTIFIDAVTADNVLNGTEARGEVAVSGTTTAEVGQTVTVNIGGVEQTALVTAGGVWTALFAADALSHLAQGLTTVNVSVSDKAGNPASGNHTFLVDTQAPTVAVNDLTADNIINAAEKGQALVISGTTVDAKVGDMVVVEFNNKPYTTQVDASGTWRIGVTAEDMATLPNGSGELTVTITDSAGNSSSITKDYQVDLGVPTLTFDDIADDNVLNAIERGSDLVISGKSSGLAERATVTVELGGREYTAQTDNGGNWSLSVAPSDLALLGDAGYTVSASASSANGNPVSGSTQLQVDTRLPVVHIDLVAGDDVINVDEAGQNLTISGSVSGAAPGDSVQVIVAGKTHNTTVEANGLWSVTVDSTDVAGFGDGPLTIDASVQNAHGNTGSDSRDIAVNTGTPGIRFDTVAGDDVINSIEQGHALAVTGTSSGLAENAIVTLSDGQGESWTGSVNADGSWAVSVPQNVVAGWSAGTVQLSATAQNSAGTTTAMDHQVTVDIAPVAITIDTFTADNVLNAIERGEALTVSGSTRNVESGQTVTVMLAGKAWTAQVQDDGSWQFTVPTGSLNALRDGTANATASVTNQHGNSASAEWAFSVDASAPTLTIAAVTADNVLNKAEVEGAVTLSGTTSAEAGQSVTVLINGQSYGDPVTVNSDGSWSLTLASNALAGLPQGSASVTVSVTDKAGNSSTATQQLTVDTVAPTVTIDLISGDDIINAAEQNQALVVTGSSVGGMAGDRVSVEVDGKYYTTQLDAQGHWSVGIPAADMQALGAGQQHVNVSITDSAGNTGTGSRPIVVDNGQPWLSFDAIAVDNVLNAVEQGVNLTLNGTSDGLAADTWVTVTLNSKEYRTQIDASGNWTLEVTPADLAQISDGTYTVTANASSEAGNPASGSAQLVVDTRAPTVTINAITDDNVLNKDESALEVVVSGKVSGAAENDIVYVLLAGKTYEATVDASLNWQATIPANELSAIGDGALTIVASVTNAHGNLGTAQHDFMVDYNEPGIRFDVVAGDDVINLSEHNQSLVVKGSSEDLPVGAKVTLVIGAKSYSGVVAADGSWSVGIDAADVKQWNEGKLEMTVSASSAAGNKVEISHEVTVDLAPVSVSVNDVTDDNVLNALEMKQPLTLSGNTTGVEQGQTVTLTFGGKVYTTTVGADGAWSHTIPAAALSALRDGTAQLSVEVTNKVGNPASTSHEYQVDTTPPHITLNPITADNVINIAEAEAGVVVTGTTNAPVGTTVTLTLNGVDYSGSVLTDGTWQVDLSPDALATLATGQYTCTVTIADAAGNPGTLSQTVSVDIMAPTVSFDITAGDDIINLVEHGQALVVSGTTSGTVAGNQVTVTVGDYTVSTVVDANGKWSIGVPAQIVSALNNGTVNISATVTDSAGNATTQGKVVTVNTSNILLTMDTPAVDGVLNASEQGKTLTLTGSSSGLAEGSEVTITLNGKNYTATVTGDRWTTTIPKADLALLTDGQRYTISVSAEDSAGNIGQAGQSLLVDTTPPEIIIAPVSGDGLLNALEQGQALVINGSTTAEAGRTLTLTVNGKSYTATVNSDGSWQTTIPKADVALMGNGTIQVDAMVSDASGNLGSNSETFVVDTVAPVVSINVVAGDDLVNQPEQLVAQKVSGKAEGAAGQTITVELAGRTYTAKVAADESWEVTVPALDFVGLVDGKYTITATVKDAAGNTGSGTHDVTLSGEKPVIAINTVAKDDVINAAERGQSLTISGTTTAPQGQKVVVTLNNVTYETTVQAGGIWSVLVGTVALMALTDGNAYEIKASVTNTIGNSGESVHGISVDLTPPQMAISIDSLTSDSGLVGNDFITNVGNVVLNGKLGAALGLGDKAQISLDGGVSWIDLVVNGTQWSYADGRTLEDGTHNYQVRVVDQAGNVGATDSQNVVLDRVAPDASQSIIIDRISSDTGIADDDFITSSQTYSLEGRLGAGLKAGEHLQIRINGGAWIELEVNGTDWIYANDAKLNDGTYAYQLRVIDDAGNVGQTASKTVTVDTVRPDMTNLVTITHISEDSGLSDSDFITNDKTLTIHGSLVSTLQPGEYVQISMDGGVTWVNTVTIGTSWYYNDTQVLDDGKHDYWVRVVDAAGNVGATDSATVTIDTVKPDDAKTITVDSISDDTGYSDSDFLTNDTSITLYGTLGRN